VRGENYIIRNFVTLIFRGRYYGRKIKEAGKGRACGTQGREKKN